MRLKRSRRYTYYSSYSPSRRSRIRWDKVAIVAGCVLVVLGLVVWLNFSRIRLFMKGYSFSQQNQILSLDSEGVSEILSHDKIDHIGSWIENSSQYQYYDEYEHYYELNNDESVEDIIATIDEIFDQYVPRLEYLKYTDQQIWELLKTASTSDLQYLIDKQYTYSQIEPYIKVKGFQYKDLDKYMKVYEKNPNYNYAVLITTYPFIDSQNKVNKEYIIKNPDNILNLVKPGFTLEATYEPSDLVELGSGDYPILVNKDETKESFLLRKEAANALVEMFEDAKKEGYTLEVNSSYRSYQRQVETYEEYENRWGGIYAKEHVANPGASEHQTGLGVDLTSLSVIRGERLVFGDTEEYKWVLKNAYKYGFILRYAEGEADITGIVHEPWHFRYVGKDAAETIYNNDWTLEEYCLTQGIIPEIEEKK